jgi:translocation and assembly module TamB
MSIFIEENGKKRLPASFYVKILIFLGLIALLTVIIRPVQQALNREMLKIRTGFIEKLENITGTTISYSSIRPSFFGSVRIKNLNFYKEEIPLFKVSQIKIHFSLWELLLRKKTFVHTVDIEKPEIYLDTQKNADYFEFISTLIKDNKNKVNKIEPFQITEFLPVNANYQIRHLNFSLTDKQTVYKLQDTNLNIKEKDGEIMLSGRFFSEYKKANLYGRTITINADSGISGICSPGLDNITAEFSVYDLICFSQDEIKKTSSFLKPISNNSTKQKRLFNLQPFKTLLTYKDNLINVKPKEENESNNYYFNYNIESKKLQGGINLNDFKPENMIKLSDELKNINDLFLMPITGYSSFVFNNGFINYNVNIKGDNKKTSTKNNSSFVVDAYGNEKEIIVNDFYITSENSRNAVFSGTLGLSGDLQFKPLKSRGSIFFNNFSLTGKETLRAVVNISGKDNNILISGENIEVAQTVIKELSILLYPMNNRMEIESSCIFSGDGAVFMEAVFTGNPEEIEASLKIDSMTLFELTEALRPFSDALNVPSVSRGILKKSSINTEIFVSTDFKKIVYNAPNIDFSSENMNMKLSLSGTDRQISLSEGIFSRNKDEILFSSDIDFSNTMDLVFLLNASYNEMTWHIEGQVLDRTTVIIRDPNGFHGYGNIASNGAFSGYIEGDNYPILSNSQTIYLNFYSSLRYNSSDFWHLELTKFTARYANAIDGADFIKISGMADQNGARIRNISYIDNSGMLLGSADFTWDEDFSFIYFDLDITDGNPEGEKYYATGTVKDDNIKIDTSVSDMRLNRFFRKSNPLLITADASISWNSIKDFDAKIKLSSLRTRIDSRAIYAAVNVNVSNDELSVNNFELDYSELKMNLSELKFNIDEGVAFARADIQGILKEKEIEGKININANFAGVDSWLDLDQIIMDLDGELSIDNFYFGDIRNEDFKLVFRCKDGAVSAKGGHKDMIRLEMDSDGVFFAGFSAPFPINGNIVGTFKKGNIDARTNNFFIDIVKLFNIFSPQKDFFIASGYITGKTQFVGPFWNPEFHGTAKAESLRFQIPNFLTEDIKVAPFDILAEGYEMTFGPVDILSGNGNGSVKGWFFFENWAPVNIGLDISIQRDNPVPYGVNIGGFLSKGSASGNLNLVIDVLEKFMEMKGDIFSNESELGLSMEDIMANAEMDHPAEMLFNSVINLKITAGSKVEFIWPVVSPILRATPEMGTVIYVSSDTQSGQYTLEGNVKIRSGELYYFDRNFYIRQGNLVLKENETKFDPRISARAEIKDRSESGTVTISMIINNQSLFSFEPRFEASPSMTQLEIYSLLGQNFNIVNGEEDNETRNRMLLSSTTDLAAQLIANTDFMSQFVFMRQFERQVRNTMKLDMFSLRTKFFQNAIVTGVSGLSQSSNQNAVDRNRNQTNSGLYLVDNTSVFIGKYISKDMFIQSMFTLKYDENGPILGGLTPELDFGIELQSPFFNIRWDFYPDFFPYHPENLPIGNSITLIWSKSF